MRRIVPDPAPIALSTATVSSFSFMNARTLLATPIPPTMSAMSPTRPRYIVSWRRKRRRIGWASWYVFTRAVLSGNVAANSA